MKTIYLVGRTNNKGHFTSAIYVHSSLKKAEIAKDYYNNLFKTNTFVIEKHVVQ